MSVESLGGHHLSTTFISVQIQMKLSNSYVHHFNYSQWWIPSSGVNLMGNFGGDDDSACGPKFESIIHIIGHDKTSDTVEDNLY